MSDFSNDLMQRVIDCLDEGLLVTGADGGLQLWNSAALAILSINEDPRVWFATQASQDSPLSRLLTSECPLTEVVLGATSRAAVVTRTLIGDDGVCRGRVSRVRALQGSEGISGAGSLRAASAREEIGKLAHDVNNRLFELMLELDPEGHRSDTAELTGAMHRASAIVERLRGCLKGLLDDGMSRVDGFARERSNTPTRRGNILVIDDDLTILSRIASALQGEHGVTAHADPREALREIASGSRFDVIICDVLMPARTGMDLYNEITLIAPHQASRIVFITGAETGVVRAFLESIPNAHLMKPFRIADLLGVVNDRLDAV